jgi:tetratricopeptide (TPR) repeat protein
MVLRHNSNRTPHSDAWQRAIGVKGRAYLCANSWKDAADQAQQALEVAFRWNQAYNLETLALVEEAKGNLQGAIENGQKAVALYDSNEHSFDAKTARANLSRWKKSIGPGHKGN